MDDTGRCQAVRDGYALTRPRAVTTFAAMRFTFDPAKRAVTLARRGLDFADAAEVFGGLTATEHDQRRDYGEVRRINAGYLRGRFVIVVRTQRGDARHIISMRHGHDSEQRDWFGER